MKPLTLLLALIWSLTFQLHAQTNPSIPTLTGIISLPDVKCAVLEAKDARSHNLILHLIMSEGQRVSEIEVLRINPERGTVEVRVAQTNALISLGGETNGAANDLPAIALEKTGLHSLLNLYAEFSGRTLLRSPFLPGYVFTLRATATNRAEAAKVLEQALVAKGIAVIPDGEKFMLIVPKAQAAAARLHSVESKFQIADGDQTFPAGSMNLFNVDLARVLPIYAGLVGRKLDSSEPAPAAVPFVFKSQTPLTKTEFVHAMDVLLEWRNIKIVAVGDDLIKPVYIRPQ